jgi:hypothetical protein
MNSHKFQRTELTNDLARLPHYGAIGLWLGIPEKANSVKEASRDDRQNDVARFMTRWNEWQGGRAQ